jgi:hypothetical protein
MEHRCNGVPECKDKSDEMKCDKVIIDQDLYQKGQPPIQLDRSRTNVTVNLTIYSFGRFDEIEMTFTAEFNMNLKW